MPGAYLILGTPGAGRREVVFDLIDGGSGTQAPVDVFIASNEPDSPFDEQLAALEHVEIIAWKAPDAARAPAPAEDTTAFFLTEGGSDFRRQLEGFKAWLGTYRMELLRVIVVIDCALAEQHAVLAPWYEAQVHFADVALLNRRENVSNKWIRDFELAFTKRHLPCQFELVKKGKVGNPPALLHPEPRRVSHFFDEGDAIDDLELDEDNLPDEPIELSGRTDPYLLRLPSGAYEKSLPAISDFLPKPPGDS